MCYMPVYSSMAFRAYRIDYIVERCKYYLHQHINRFAERGNLSCIPPPKHNSSTSYQVCVNNRQNPSHVVATKDLRRVNTGDGEGSCPQIFLALQSTQANHGENVLLQYSSLVACRLWTMYRMVGTDETRLLAFLMLLGGY